MTHRPLHQAVAAALVEAKAPKVVASADVQAQLQPILVLATDSQKQIAEHRQKLFLAQIADPDSDGHMERLHQTLNAWEKDVHAMIEALRRVRLAALQYERYAKEIEAELTPKTGEVG